VVKSESPQVILSFFALKIVLIAVDEQYID